MTQAFSGFSSTSVLPSEDKMIPHAFLLHILNGVLISEGCFAGEDIL